MPTTTQKSYVPSSSLFAKLLAEENLTVRIDPFMKTAAFNTEERTLLLPMLKDMHEDAWLLFIAHEVAHAKYTPADWRHHPTVASLMQQYGVDRVHSVLNILEDIRIERLIRQRYQGLTGTFVRGYRHLLSQNFFKFPLHPVTQQPDVQQRWAQYGPLDRLNLYAKVGGILHLSLVSQPQVAWWYARATACETFPQIVTLLTEVLASLQKQSEMQPRDGQQPQQMQPAADGMLGEMMQDDAGSQDQPQEQPTAPSATPSEEDATEHGAAPGTTPPTESGPVPEDATETDEGGSTGAGAGVSTEHTSTDLFATETQDAADAFFQRARVAGDETVVMLPRDTSHYRMNVWQPAELLHAWGATTHQRTAMRSVVLRERKQAHAVLASMVNTFRQYQAAWQQRREDVSRTGLLDMNKLSQYKLVEDLFLRKTDVPTAQNHGIVLTLDWSGSMENSLPTVLWQVLHLIWFAEQVRIPVDVYAFTDAYGVQQTPAVRALTERSRPTALLTTEDRLSTYFLSASRQGSLLRLYAADLSASDKMDMQSFLMALSLRYAKLGGAFYTLMHEKETTPFSARFAHARQYGLQALPRAAESALEQIIATVCPTEEEVRDFLQTPHGLLCGTPLYHGIFMVTEQVRAFRERHRVEQCVSVILTDGDDGHGISTLSPETVMLNVYLGNGEQACHDSNVTLIDPKSGRVFPPVSGATSALPQVLSYHRTRTGATTLLVDLTARPGQTYRRFMSASALRKFEALLTDMDGVYTTGRSRRSRRAPVTVTKKTTRRKLVIPSSTKGFSDTGLFAIDPQQEPSLTVDAVLVSHPQWWTYLASKSVDPFTAKSIRRITEDTYAYGDTEDEIDADASAMIPSDESVAAKRVVLSASLMQTSGSVAMRKFSDLLMPYIASGRADAQ